MFKGVPTYITSAHAELGLLMTFLELLKRKNTIFYVPRAIDSIAARKKKKRQIQHYYSAIRGLLAVDMRVVHIC